MREKLWKDVCVRKSYDGYHYLLQVCELESGRKVFRNRSIDNGLFGTKLFPGFQGTVEKLLN